MKPIVPFLVGLIYFVIFPAILTPAQDPPNVKNEQPVGNKPRQPEVTSSSAGYQQQSYVLGTECGIYLCEAWKPGIISLKDGTRIDDRLIRYNIYNQQMEYATEGDTAAIGNPEDLKSLVIDGRTFVYRAFICQQKELQGYLELLVEGDYELLLFRGIRYEYRDNPFGKEEGGPVTSYFADSRYFLSCFGQTAESLPESKKEILDLMGQNRAKLKTFLKEQNCKLKDEEDLVRFFSYANEI